MALSSFSFLAFLAIVVLAYYVVPKKVQWVVLLIASYAFYLFSGIEHVVYIIGTTLITYGAGRWMQKIRDKGQAAIDAAGDSLTKDQKREAKKAAAKRIHVIQVLTVLFNLCVLAYFKYLGFFVENINRVFALFHWDASIPFVNVLAPLGLSYYTFNSIGYLIDVGRGKIAAEKNVGKFALFVSFFPSIIQGPLFRYGDVGNQLKSPHKFEYNNLKFGAQLMLWGFFKKLVIADRVAAIARTVFAAGFSNYTGSHIFFGVLAYSFQIYCDFGGGIDITRGAAQMLGIDLPVNFEQPFFATSMGDFWRRWHMSLGAWMREFVFYPIMLSKPVTAVSKSFRKRFGSHAGKIVPSVAAPLVVFFLIGIWHGLSWRYIINGLYNALLISSSVALQPLYNKLAEKLHINTQAFSFRVFQMIRTFGLLCISRIIVKAPSIRDALKMIKALFTSWDLDFIFGLDGTIFTYGVGEKEMFILFIAILVLIVVGVLRESGMKMRETIAKQNILYRWALVLGLLVFVLVFGIYGPEYDASAFIYGQF
ncbi:MAG: MBOAT family protein [Clostridiales bacterium]|nr:MBOAT family protein [Clostridiales bacterium]